jgi:nucleotide sugar dehydrogenase
MSVIDAAEANVYVICVPTPVDQDRNPDYSYVVTATQSIARVLKPGDLVILESTVAPGTTETLLLDLLQSGSSLLGGTDFHLAFSPERIDPQNNYFQLKNTPKIVGGLTDKCRDLAIDFYSKFVDSVVEASGLAEAEAAKILENTYRLVNISLINQFADACSALGIDVSNVIKLAGTKPFGFQTFFPSVGAGGHCIPVDPHYLIHVLKDKAGIGLSLVEEAARFNDIRAEQMAERIWSIAEDLYPNEVRSRKVLFLGLSYKRDVADFRESRQVEVVRDYCSKGGIVEYHDFYLSSPLMFGAQVDDSDLQERLSKADLIVLLQAHAGYLEEDLLLPHAAKLVNFSGMEMQANWRF